MVCYLSLRCTVKIPDTSNLMTSLQIVNSTQNNSADFATIFSNSFVYNNCLSCAQKVFCWIPSFHECCNKKYYFCRVDILILDEKKKNFEMGKRTNVLRENIVSKKKNKKKKKLIWKDGKIGRPWKSEFIFF